jgi:hypothetical protein
MEKLSRVAKQVLIYDVMKEESGYLAFCNMTTDCEGEQETQC